MSKTMLEQLPEIVRAGKRQTERILEELEAQSHVVARCENMMFVSNFRWIICRQSQNALLPR